MKKSLYILFISILGFFLYPKVSLAYDYTIDSYMIDINVEENNTFDITEKIAANFKIPKHGIFRNIPYINKVVRSDGTSSNNIARISDISVNATYSLDIDEDKYELKIGDADRVLTGLNNYQISYRYSLSEDGNKDYDELYYNIIGTGWDTTLDNVQFRITMPKEFDQSKLGFSIGRYGSGGSDDIKYTVEGNVITGYVDNKMSPGDALTIRLELPEGYFNNKKTYSWYQYIVYILPIITAFLAYYYWNKYGKDRTVVETVEFYPPNNLNSLEIAFLYKGKVSSNDVTSLLIYLANKGYLKIEEEGKKKFKIIKLKDYDGNDANEEKFMNGLFAKKDEVTKKDLENKFYKITNNIISNTNKSSHKAEVFEKDNIKKIIYLILMVTLTIFLGITIPIYTYTGFTGVFGMVALLLFYIPFYLVMFIPDLPLGFMIPWGLFTLVHSLAFFSATPLATIITRDSFYFLSMIILIVSMIISLIFIRLMPKRTEYGSTMLGKIKGFKNFLLHAEKPKLEELVMENPSYFYDILPYTYVLGVSSKWIKKFESINVEPPDWYSGYDPFTYNRFSHFLNDTITTANASMVSTPSSSGSTYSGGGFSGGGFSGGGSGGGGGGSW